MLAEISIRNLAIIEELRVTFARGFHVLTGETGAGKSIIIDALGLAAGGRGSSGLVRHGSDKAEIEAIFDIEPAHPVWAQLDQFGIAYDVSEYLLIRREITSTGKSTARVNGQLVNLSMLKEIGDLIVNIHGQHEHQSLLRIDKHLLLLDAYGGQPVAEAKAAYSRTYEAYRAVEEELEALQSGAQQALQMADLYRFQADEIAAAALVEGEDDKLEEERHKLANAEKLMDGVVHAYDGLYGPGKALDLVSEASGRLESVASFDPGKLQPIAEQIQSAYYQLEDAAFQLRAYRDSLEFEPDRLNLVEERLGQISALKRKYGATIADILQHYAHIVGELDKTENVDERLKELGEKREKLGRQLEAEAGRLTAARKEAAKALADAVERQLRDLQMERTRFAVWFEEGERGQRHFTPSGADRIEFRISPNPGQPLQPLSKIASGGELSRIMLAIKTIFAAQEEIPVLVFDEVDTGVSGRAAQAIAVKLANLSKHNQVFSVTHLPQVASMADGHYVIVKEVEGERTFTKIKALEGEERVAELARMLGGAQVTETTLKHAREMIELARR